jgi:arylsulfatase A-like enzyme
MQASAPRLIDLGGESRATLELYGAEPGKPSFANNCLMARRLVERGVRFVQLYHTNWDSHGGPGENLQGDFEKVCREVDQPCAALVKDLKERGMLDDTLVVWGGEFGRTPMGESRDTTGRNHHIECSTVWLAGGGVKAGFQLGQTDELGFSPTEDPVHVHDLHATLLHLLGLEHTRLTFRFQGRDFRLTDVAGKVIEKLLV